MNTGDKLKKAGINIPFETVTVKASDFLEANEKVTEIEVMKQRVNKMIDLIRDAGIKIESNKDIFSEDITEVLISKNALDAENELTVLLR